MDYSDLKTDFASRGYDYLSSARQGQFINDAMHELDESYLWPYREASAVGVAPLIVSDLGTIELVDHESLHYALEPRSFQWLKETFGDLTTSGAPVYYYVAWPSGSPEIATYPSNTDNIGVQYWRIRDDLSADSDTPLAPSRFHNIIVDIAVRMALNDSDNYAGAQAIQSEIDRKIARMVNALLGGQQVQGPGDVFRDTFASEDW